VSILKHREIDSCGPCRGPRSRATRCASLSISRAEHIGNTSYCTASPTHHLSPITRLPFSRPPHGHSQHTSSTLDSLRFPVLAPPGLCFSLSSTCTVVVGLGRYLLALLNPALRLCALSQINHPACPPHYSDYTHKDLSRTPILGYGVYVIILTYWRKSGASRSLRVRCFVSGTRSSLHRGARLPSPCGASLQHIPAYHG
jgi:hypothetical protein